MYCSDGCKVLKYYVIITGLEGSPMDSGATKYEFLCHALNTKIAMKAVFFISLIYACVSDVFLH